MIPADTQLVCLIGAHKAGTTSLAHWLSEVPGVSVAEGKEPNTFAHRPVDRPKDHYWRLFDADAAVYVDASTSYSMVGCLPLVPERIFKASADAKIVYLTRDPLSRLWSSWKQHVDESAFEISADYRRALLAEPKLRDAGLYMKQLAAYRRYFPEEQIFTIPFEIISRSRAYQERLFEFLELPMPSTPLPHLNSGETKQRDRAGAAQLLYSGPGAAIAGAMRQTPLRNGLASFRRRHLMADITDERPPDAELAAAGWCQEILRDASDYLAELHIDTNTWPSMALIST